MIAAENICSLLSSRVHVLSLRAALLHFIPWKSRLDFAWTHCVKPLGVEGFVH